jgi:putative oxidoreductase
MKTKIIIETIGALLIGLFLYASFSKYLDYASYKKAMYNQPFQAWFSAILLGVIPPAEILIALLLIPERTRIWGLYASFGIMTLFSLYIAAILLHLFPWVPCSCGGVIRQFTWQQHLFFNLFFLGISTAGIYMQARTERKINNHRRSSN